MNDRKELVKRPRKRKAQEAQSCGEMVSPGNSLQKRGSDKRRNKQGKRLLGCHVHMCGVCSERGKESGNPLKVANNYVLERLSWQSTLASGARILCVVCVCAHALTPELMAQAVEMDSSGQAEREFIGEIYIRHRIYFVWGIKLGK